MSSGCTERPEDRWGSYRPQTYECALPKATFDLHADSEPIDSRHGLAPLFRLLDFLAMRDSRKLEIVGPLLVAGLLAALVSGCGADGPALSVDGVDFSEEELLGLTDDREDRLVALTALGLAFSRDEIDAVGAPLLERRREDLLLDRFAADLVLERAGVEDDVLRAQYLTNPQYELVVRHVVSLAEEGDADSVHQAARATAEEALERVEAGEPLADVAADLSEEPGAAERGGRLQPGRRGSWVPGFWQAANSLEEGDHTDVVQTQYGYHVIQLEERRIVPFEEVRSDVVLRAGTMLGGTEEAWSSWRDSVSASIRLDTATILQSVEDGDLDLAPLALARDSSAEGADRVLATWNGAGDAGSYTLAAFRRHLASLPENRWRTVSSSPLAEVVEEAVRHRALAEAAERELSLSEGPLEQTAREWRDQANAWAVPLGFEASSPTSAVADQALSALSTTRQNASIAREELESREPLLRAAYIVREASDP